MKSSGTDRTIFRFCNLIASVDEVSMSDLPKSAVEVGTLRRSLDFADFTELGSLHDDQVSYRPALRENVMKIVPVIKSGDLERSVRFYTRILDSSGSGPDMKIARWPTESLT